MAASRAGTIRMSARQLADIRVALALGETWTAALIRELLLDGVTGCDVQRDLHAIHEVMAMLSVTPSCDDDGHLLPQKEAR